MSDYNVSAVTFIKDTMKGAFCLFESMASFLPFVSDMVVLDLGSTDGTLEYLNEIAKNNSRVRIAHGSFTRNDASAFADVANQCVSLATHSNVLFWQADEIWHEELLLRMEDHFKRGIFDMSFWRFQLKENFQVMKWLPHPIHRVGPKDNFNFVDDGMNTDRAYGVTMCSDYNMGYFTKWGEVYGTGPKSYTLPTEQMVLDVSKSGGFIDNIRDRAVLHAPMWGTGKAEVDGTEINAWLRQQSGNPNWKKYDTPYIIPNIMRWHLGQPRYRLRDELFDALKNDTTRGMLGI